MSRPRARLLAMTAAACTAAALVTASPAHADPVDDVTITPGADTATPRQVTGVDAVVGAGDPATAARSYLSDNVDVFGIADPDGDLATLDSYAADGTETVRFAQTHNGVPVFGAQYLVHMRPDGDSTRVLSANGTYYTGLTVDTTATTTADVAADRARDYVAESLADGRFRAAAGPEMTVENQGLVVVPDGAGALAYRVRVTTADPATGVPVIKNVFVDAHTAWPLFAVDAVQFDTPVEGTGVMYSGEEVTLNLTLGDDGAYRFIDRSKDSEATLSTYDGREYDYLDVIGGMPADMPVFGGPGPHFEGEATEDGLVDAHVNAGHVYDFYRSLGRDGLDGRGGDIVSVVGISYFGTPFVNAFWDGEKMVYGGGDAEYRTMSADLDVVGHEMTHGVVEHTAGLLYLHQSGAINEGVADYFGNAIDVEASGTPMSDPDAGLLGEDLCRSKGPRECALRDLNDGRTTADYEGMTIEYDNGGVHANSTIFSGALWDIRESLGAEKADKLIYKALSEYMTPTDDFVSARDAVVQAAVDSRYGVLDVIRVIGAFLKHGIYRGWDRFAGDATRLMDGLTVTGTGPAAAGGWWVMPQSGVEGAEPYTMYSGRTDGRGEPIKLSDPIGDRYNVLPATDGEWAVWFAWGASNAWIMRAPVDGSAPPQHIATMGGRAVPSRLSVDGDWITWTATVGGWGQKQYYVDAGAENPVATPVDSTYYMQSGFGTLRDGKLYYILQWPDRKPGGRTHLNIAVRDLETGEETLMPEFLLDGSTDTPAGLYAPTVTDEYLVVGVDQYAGQTAGLWRMDLDGSDQVALISETGSDAPYLGAYEATNAAVTFENWPGTAPKIYQMGIDGGKIRPMSCSDGVQYRVAADEGRRAVWLDGSYGTTSLVVRDRPRGHC